jgi:hypothetical protein
MSPTIRAELVYMEIWKSYVSAGVQANGSYCINKHYLTVDYVYRRTRCVASAPDDPRESAEGNATLENSGSAIARYLNHCTYVLWGCILKVVKMYMQKSK